MNDIENPPTEGLITRQCRICTYGDNEGKLIAPCNCEGTMKYVHQKCINRWIKIKQNPERCEICHGEFEYIVYFIHPKSYIYILLACVSFILLVIFISLIIYVNRCFHNANNVTYIIIPISFIIIFTVSSYASNISHIYYFYSDPVSFVNYNKNFRFIVMSWAFISVILTFVSQDEDSSNGFFLFIAEFTITSILIILFFIIYEYARTYILMIRNTVSNKD